MCRDTLVVSLKKVLVIEDDVSIGEVLQLALEQEGGYQPFVVANPFEALASAKSLVPDLFIIDYHLSGMNGIHLYDQIHGSDGLQKIPAIITTASLESHGEELQARGLTGLAKPFDLDELLSTIKQTLPDTTDSSYD